MDPLARELACDCVAGFAQRRYEALAMVLERRLGRPCTSLCGHNLAAHWGDEGHVDLIVGKHSEVMAQAKRMGRRVHPIASLTDLEGETTFQGLFVVRAGSAAQSLEDLGGYRVLFGPASCDEKHAAALAKLRDEGVPGFEPGPVETVDSCTDAANTLMELSDDDKAAAVISDYAQVLLEGCHTIPKGSLRVIGRTDPIPFVTVFATEEMSPGLRDQVRGELLAANRYSKLRKLLESKHGFRPFAPAHDLERPRAGWSDFRGPDRRALVPKLPDSLDGMLTAWTAGLDAHGLGGVTASDRWVLATDRDPETGRDCLKVFDAATGSLALNALLVRPPREEPDPKLDYGQSIRSSPVIHGDRIFLLDAYGAIFACPLPEMNAHGRELVVEGTRTESMTDQFKLARWGVASTPLVVDGRLIVNVCAAETTLLALDAETLEPIWKGPGAGTGYASCVAGTFGGRRQILGYQRESFSGWDAASGELLWSVRPDFDGDYNVPSPIVVDRRRVLLATENNGTRLYQFNPQGVLQPEPVATNLDVAPDTVTPVVVGGFAYCTWGQELSRIDLNNGLKSDWSTQDEAFLDHVSLIADADGQRLMVVTYHGELLLYDISGSVPRFDSRGKPLGLAVEEEIYSHPALVGNRLYLRGSHSLVCVVFDAASATPGSLVR
jgi:ABC-type phosphate/phosphonate transport system substrate-binding protein